VEGDRLYTAYIGDSRIYLIRDGKIQRLTVDHTWVQEAIEKGIITPEQARDHPTCMSSVVTWVLLSCPTWISV
jgi:protein phosphatase